MAEEIKNENNEAVTESALPGTDFIREQIKLRPVNRKKLLRRTLMTVALAVVFGLVATLTFFLLEPLFNRALNTEKDEPADPVVLVEQIVEEEVLPEDLIADDEAMQEENRSEGMLEALEDYVFDASDYAEMTASLKSVAQEAQKSLVTVTRVTSGTVWSGDAFLTSLTSSGLIVADNGNSYLILTDLDTVSGAEEIRVSFPGTESVTASLYAADTLTRLAVLSVSKNALSEAEEERIAIATLGTSASAQLIGQPVIAIGCPAGVPGSIMYGAVTTNAKSAAFPDANYMVLSTDIVTDGQANGVLINTRGDVIGFFSPYLNAYFADNAAPSLQAYGISAIRKLVERLSNGYERAYLGIFGADVPSEVREREQIPQGAYVTQVEMNAPAMIYGIQSGDVIVAVNDTEIVNFTAFSALLLDYEPEDVLEFRLMRPSAAGYTEMTLTISLGHV